MMLVLKIDNMTSIFTVVFSCHQRLSYLSIIRPYYLCFRDLQGYCYNFVVSYVDLVRFTYAI
jgi:hypothetical protein